MPRERTHWEGCWRERTHHECALVRIKALEIKVEAREKRVAELEAALADERKRREDAEALLHDYSRLANAAMFDANRSGYEYDRKGEMVGISAHFARYKD